MLYSTESNLQDAGCDKATSDAQSTVSRDEVRGLASNERESLIGNLRRRIAESNREAQKGRSLRELAKLLEKNPEVARILDLMEEVKF